MARAKDDRKPVGTIGCPDCETTAAFYQVQKGNRAGYLYKRCGCGADQSVGKAKQQRWLQEMTRTDAPWLPHPLELEQPETRIEPTPDQGEIKVEPTPNPGKYKGFLGVVGLFLTVTTIIFLS